MVVHTGKYSSVGKLWSSVILYRSLVNVNFHCWKHLIQRRPQILGILYQILSIALGISILVFFLSQYYSKFNDPSIYVFICGVDISFMGIIGVLYGLKLGRIFRYREQLPLFDLLYVISLLFVAVISLYITVILIYKEIYSAWILLLGLFNIGLIENLNMIGWLLIFPVIGISFIFETIKRIIRYDLRCPKREEIILKYQYNLFCYNNEYKEAKCAICLMDFTKEELICTLSCHKSHIFHEECIQEWVKKQTTCPICRQIIEFK